MLEIVNHKANQYSSSFSTPEDALVEEIAHYTLGNHPESHMLSGHIQGRFLQILSKLIAPSKVLEIGTFTGYSALCLASGLTTNGILHTIEVRDSDADIAEVFFKKSLYYNQINLHRGDAKAIIPTMTDTWDIVFIDADKISYIDYYELTLPMVRQGGLIIADNVLFHGEVFQDIIHGKNAKAMDTFNKYVSNDNRVEQVIITLRDGLMLIRKN